MNTNLYFKGDFFDLQKVVDNLKASGLQQKIDKQIAEGDDYCPQPGIIWVIWDDIIVPIAKGIGKALL